MLWSEIYAVRPGKRLLPTHNAKMDQILPPELNRFEFEAMRQIAVHPTTCHVPSAIRSRLQDIGYAKEVLGRLVLTPDGLKRVHAVQMKQVRRATGHRSMH